MKKQTTHRLLTLHRAATSAGRNNRLIQPLTEDHNNNVHVWSCDPKVYTGIRLPVRTEQRSDVVTCSRFLKAASSLDILSVDSSFFRPTLHFVAVLCHLLVRHESRGGAGGFTGHKLDFPQQRLGFVSCLRRQESRCICFTSDNVACDRMALITVQNTYLSASFYFESINLRLHLVY